MTEGNINNTSWNEWLMRWDKMQQGYLPWREHVYALMLNCLSYWLPSPFVALDIACGPGSISNRLLGQFPHSQSVGIDFDPVLLAIGRNTLGTANGRMTWIEADLRNPSWLSELPFQKADAIVSSTALHWLSPDELTALYMRLGAILNPGGVFLNADEMRPASARLWPFFHDWSRKSWKDAFPSQQSEDWDGFWNAVSQDRGLQKHYVVRQERLATLRCTSDSWGASFPLHAEILRSAGFEAIETIWQEGIEHLIIALR